MIEVRNLQKSYGSTVAVNNVSFTLPEGKVVGFLGPNGSGKSTTMRLMLGLDYGSGETLYDGKHLKELDSVTQVVGAHLDAKYFHPKRTARNHLCMLGTEAGVSKSRVDEVISLLGLSSVADASPGGFSLGMGQRLGLAGAILAQPKTLMLDEPATGLDPQSIQWLRDFLKEYASRGNTVFVSSHLLSEMQLMADHIVVIAKGSLIADESMDEFIARSTSNDVLIRTDVAQIKTLTQSLELAGFSVTPESSNSLAIRGATLEAAGRVAFSVNAPVLELQSRQASLETAFIEATASQQGYETGATQ